MMRRIIVSALVVACSLPAYGEDAKSILETARAKQAQRWASVNNYTITLSVEDSGGLQTPVYYEKIEVDGKPTFRMVSPTEYLRTLNEQAGFPPMTPEAMEQMAEGLGMTADAVAQGGGDMPPMDFHGMTDDMSLFLRAGADYEENDGRGDAKDAVSDMNEFMKRAKLSGTEGVQASGKNPGQMQDAYLLVADDVSDISLKQPEDGAKYTMKKASLWIDKEQYVPRKLLMDVEAESKGQKTPIVIEKLDLDYKQVGPLYESHQQVYRLSGLMSNMSEKERKDMEKAKKDMEKAKKDLEKMPKDQRDMVMKMMGPQMEKFEKMMAGNEITSVTNVVSIAINEGPPAPYGLGTLEIGGPAARNFPGALTMAGDDGHAELAVAARSGETEAIIGLVAAQLFPKSGGVAIARASGKIDLPGDDKIVIESGTGTITVTERSDTHIAGTFTALLKGTHFSGGKEQSIDFSASGKFDSGAPVGPYQAPRGSPLPADLFKTQ